MNREKWYARVTDLRGLIWNFDARATICWPLDWLLRRLACCETCDGYHVPHCEECCCKQCIPF